MMAPSRGHLELCMRSLQNRMGQYRAEAVPIADDLLNSNVTYTLMLHNFAYCTAQAKPGPRLTHTALGDEGLSTPLKANIRVAKL